MTEHRWLITSPSYERFGSHVRERSSLRNTESLRSSWHERSARLDSGGSSLTSRRDNRLPSVGNKTDEEPNKDFKKKQDHSSSQVGLLEAEKREKRVLERKMSEMEDDLKALTDLKFDNQRLKDENGALIRVISKLSK
ncbi:protein phosphatase 1 regulatory subunit 12B-like isoform X5 [Dendrobates tinctorius]|uniref:protein phosphatase 1 regulatory subunit 12B-like isoform X5 n=1 Tax=Dendrobates tinctorius TaxID=92724 RepID=UPI003CC9F7B1